MIRRAAIECGEYYVTRKWVGGTLTNCTHTLGANRHPDLIVFFSLPISETALSVRGSCQHNQLHFCETNFVMSSICLDCQL